MALDNKDLQQLIISSMGPTDAQEAASSEVLDFLLQEEGAARLEQLADAFEIEQDTFRQKLTVALRDIFQSNMEAKLQSLFTHIDVVIASPGDADPHNGDGDFDFDESIVMQPKTWRVLDTLNKMGIGLDNCMRFQGTVDTDMRRKTPYRVFVIPSLHKTILVCDESRQRTFVCFSFDWQDFASLNKTELNNHPDILPINWTESLDNWQERLETYLLADDPTPHKLPASTPRPASAPSIPVNDIVYDHQKGLDLFYYPLEPSTVTLRISNDDIPDDGIINTRAHIMSDSGDIDTREQKLIFFHKALTVGQRITLQKRIDEHGIEPVEGICIRSGNQTLPLYDYESISYIYNFDIDDTGIASFRGMPLANIRSFAQVIGWDASMLYKMLKDLDTPLRRADEVLPCVLTKNFCSIAAHFVIDLMPFSYLKLDENLTYIFNEDALPCRIPSNLRHNLPDEGEIFMTALDFADECSINSPTFQRWMNKEQFEPLMNPFNPTEPWLAVRSFNKAPLYKLSDLEKLRPIILNEDGKKEVNGRIIVGIKTYTDNNSDVCAYSTLRARIRNHNIQAVDCKVLDADHNAVVAYYLDEIEDILH